jgi:hypothetical protein
VTPGASSGTQKAVRPLAPSAGSIVAKTVACEAMPRLEMKIFSPPRIQPPSASTARVAIAATSLPASG